MAYTIEDYRQWILKQTSPDYEISEPDERTIRLTTNYGHGDVVFYPQDIVELLIVNNSDDSYSFYLHFQLHEQEHAESLFREMRDSLLKLRTRQNVKVLLSCTGGLTTNYFAMELNKAAETLKTNYEFNAVAYSQLYEEGFKYDVILLAPQIHYLYDQVSSIFSNTLVMKIPAATFAQYNTGELLQLVQEEYKKFTDEKKEQNAINLEKPFENDFRILTLAFIGQRDMYRCAYRIYDHGQKTLDKEIIKDSFSQRDIEDLLDYITARHKKVDAICIAVPGVTYHGHLYFPELGFINEPLGDYLSAKYHKPVILVNDVNAITIGYRALHEDCDNMLFYFQPVGGPVGGAGVIIDGKLHRGYKHAAGELGGMVSAFIEDANEKIFTPEGALEIVMKNLLIYIMTLAPKKIVLFSVLTPDMNKLRAALNMHVAADYIPELIHVDQLKTFMMPGAMIRCLQVLQDNADWVKQVTVEEKEEKKEEK